jgi:hypothetical protein
MTLAPPRAFAPDKEQGARALIAFALASVVLFAVVAMVVYLGVQPAPGAKGQGSGLCGGPQPRQPYPPTFGPGSRHRLDGNA